ncbi:ABC transporter, carbohydrate uptake transporter-1 (CUT1) family, permease protein [Thermosipho africanus TCF52B]|uniref:ABC transporter, carbohydrate uptake transporter-1 (CUT1) family, permease protein n=1 Tax=Thermosipho africanus (strain TCF52B) TaxID=484019 RepID=B7IH36_THEAB|nr:carbohydrate ABC transporter permease [Thermosipho africanus]ACJ75400.1 ABC transporter, carbohydrate uptake transporter-1 (CUT1) family, permease protein [Thermosipho africanus TCF52B]
MKKFFSYFFLIIIIAIYIITPLYVLLATSFKPLSEIGISDMWKLPKSWSLSGLIKAFNKLSPNLKNSFYLTIPATIVSALLGSLNGYVFSKVKFKGVNIIFAIILFGMFIPYQSVLFPLIRFLQKVNLYGTITGLIIVHVVYGIPITSLIFRNYYSEVPNELIEAAYMDGAGFFKTYSKVLFPISIPAFVVVIIWQFTNIWNEFLFAVTVTSNPAKQPITVALVNLAGSQVVEWNVQMAGALITALPTLVVYILLGKYFIRGLLSGSVKG